MAAVTVELRSIDGTQAALGWAGAHTVVVDRPEGRAGGLGLGFNGAELMAMSIGGCFCNDLRYVAYEMGVRLDRISVAVTLELTGDPPLASAATMHVVCETSEGDAGAVIERARAISFASNSVQRGFPVTVRAG